MKFGDKYEVLEMVTSGRVSTLLARERTTQEAVVVYTFESPGAAGELSTASIIARFCGLAPNPPGMIVKAGYDAPSATAFITTKMPDPVALKAWVKAYHAFVPKADAAPAAPARPIPPSTPSDATVELNPDEVKSVFGPSAARNPSSGELGSSTSTFTLGGSAPAAQEPGGEFTRLFQDLNAFQPTQRQAPAAPLGNSTGALFGEKPANVPAAEPVHPPAAESSPGSFTREFLGLPVDPAPAAPKAPPVAAREEPAFSIGGQEGSSQSSGEFTRLFQDVNAFQPVKRSEPPAAGPGNATGAIFGERLGSTSLGSAPPAKPATPAPAESSPGSFTQEFLGLSSQNFESAPKAPPSPATPAKQPGSFTQEFMAVSKETFRSTEPASTGAFSPPKPATPAVETSFDNIFGGPPPQTSAPGRDSGAPKDGAGDFTNFFSSPFENPRASEKPIALPDIVSAPPPQKQASEFTQMFGRDDLRPNESSSSPRMADEPQPAGSFTQIFGQTPPGSGKGSQLGASSLDTKPNLKPSFLDTPAPPSPSPAMPDPFRASMTPPAASTSMSTPALPRVDPFFSSTPVATPPPANPFASRAGSTDATNIFRAPGGEAPSAPAPSGPSEFTMFLSRSELNASLPPEAQAQLGGAPPPPAAPAPFQFAPPPMPAAPKFPAAPAPPAMPKPAIAAPAAKASSIWPLITGLTVLVAIAVILVMYFLAAKH